MEEPRHIQVVDFTHGKRDSEGVDTTIPFSSNFEKCKTIQHANVVIAAYVNANYKDNFKIREDLDKAINDIVTINDEISDINAELLDQDGRITTNKNNIDTINTNITNINNNISNIESAILDIDERLNNHDSAITDIENDILDLNNLIITINTHISNIESSILVINNEIANIESTILDNSNDIIKVNNKTKYLIAIKDLGAKFKVDIINTLEENMILNVKVPTALVGDSAEFSIDNGVTYNTVYLNYNLVTGSVISGLYLTLRYDGSNWQSENLNKRLNSVETNGVIGATQYGGTLSSNLDTIIKSGFYTCYTGTTGLSTEMNAYGLSFHILHQNSNVGTNGAYQRAIAFDTSILVFERTKIAGVWSNWINKNKLLDNVTKSIIVDNPTNGDYKISINNSLVTGLILNISFPTALVNTANARLSIDNGVTYKNIYNILASEIENRNVSLIYDGTNWQLNSIINHTNANGNYTKYPDGTMISMQKTVFTNVAVNTVNGALFINIPFITLNNFPTNFTAVPNVCNSVHAGSLTMIAEANNPTASNPGSVFIVRTVGTPSLSGEIHTHAVGKWK